MDRPSTLGELARRLGLEYRGDADVPIHGVCTLRPGQPGCISFLSNPRYRSALADTRASAVVLTATDAASFDGAALIAPDPYLAFARIGRMFAPDDTPVPGIHPTAVVDASAQIGEDVEIQAGAVIGAQARIGAGSRIGAQTVIADDVHIGAGARIAPRVTIEAGVRIGERVRINPGAVIGSRGFGLAMGPEGWEEVPQLGGVQIGDAVEIGANSTIDRGALEDTVIGRGVKIDNLVQIAHNVQIGDHTAIAGCVGIAGSTRIGARCLIGGGCGIGGHLEICDGVILLGFSMVTRSIRAPGQYGSGLPVDEAATYRRNVARFRRLAKLEQRVRTLETRLGVQDRNDGGDHG